MVASTVTSANLMDTQEMPMETMDAVQMIQPFDPLAMDILTALEQLLVSDIPVLLKEHRERINAYPAFSIALKTLEEQTQHLKSIDTENKQVTESSQSNNSIDGEDTLEVDFEAIHQLLNALSVLLLLPFTTQFIRRRFRPLLVDLVARWLGEDVMSHFESKNDDTLMDVDQQEDIHLGVLSTPEMALIAFSRLLPTTPQIRR
jgi:hypothetical protein